MKCFAACAVATTLAIGVAGFTATSGGCRRSDEKSDASTTGARGDNDARPGNVSSPPDAAVTDGARTAAARAPYGNTTPAPGNGSGANGGGISSTLSGASGEGAGKPVVGASGGATRDPTVAGGNGVTGAGTSTEAAITNAGNNHASGNGASPTTQGSGGVKNDAGSATSGANGGRQR